MHLLFGSSIDVAFSGNKNVDWRMIISPQVPFTITQNDSKYCIESRAKVHPKIVSQSCHQSRIQNTETFVQQDFDTLEGCRYH